MTSGFRLWTKEPTKDQKYKKGQFLKEKYVPFRNFPFQKLHDIDKKAKKT